MTMIREVFEKLGERFEHRFEMESAVEPDLVCADHGRPVHVGVGQVVTGGGREGIGELVLVHVENGLGASQHVAGVTQERWKIQHVGCQNNVGRPDSRSELDSLLGKSQCSSEHAPLPESTGKCKQLDIVVAVALIPLGPRQV